MRMIISFLLFLFYFQITFAQLNDTSFIHHVFHSEAFDGERKVTVHLPSRYLENPDEPMMVTYVLDAQGPQYFNMLVANLDYLTSRYGIIPTIVVGIHSEDRFAEFTPFAREGSKNGWEATFESKLLNLYNHFEKEVFPLVEANYRTKQFKAIIGHSRGGSFVVQSLFDGHKNLFDAYLAISPALQFDNYQSIDLAEQSLSSKVPLNKFFYISSGDVGENELSFNDHVNKLDNVIKNNPDNSLKYNRWFFPDKDHFTTVIPSVNQGMVLLKNEYMVSFENIYQYAKDSTMDITEQMDIFINEKKANNIFLHEPPLKYYLYLANEFLEMEDYKNACAMFEWVNKKEQLVNWYDVLNLGICHKKLGQKEFAKNHFDQSLLLLDLRKEEYGDKFDKIKMDVIKQIEE